MKIKTIALIVGIALLLIVVFGYCSPSGRMIWNRWFYQVQKTDDATNYNTLKNVEDSCRAMMASYNSDELIYRQYKDSENEEKQSWAEQAKMRANKTASVYNEYILKNSYVWNGNIPADLKKSLTYISED